LICLFRRFFLLFCVVGITLLPCCVCARSAQEKAVNLVLNTVAKSMKKKYGIRPIGTSVSIPSGELLSLGVEFQVQEDLSREETGRMILDIVDFTLRSASKYHVLEKYNLDETKVVTTLHFCNADHSRRVSPDILASFYEEGYVSSIVFDPEKGHGKIVDKYRLDFASRLK
jgi:hypothetical protein